MNTDALPGMGAGQRAPEPNGQKRKSASRADPNRGLARELVNEWWERQEPRPQQNYMGAVKVVEKALGDWGEQKVRAVLNADPPVISGGALQVAAKRDGPRSTWNNGDYPVVLPGGGDHAGK